MHEPNVPNFENLSPEARENIQNRVFRLFVSSTFNDMQLERDRLLQNVFSRFKRRCKERDVEFVPIDLRWGVTEDQGAKGRTVGICLQEILRSRPFFIGLVGERYGWIPKKRNIDISDFDRFRFLKEGVQQGLSVTEIEFQVAALREESQTEAGFWLRSGKMKTPNKFRERKEKSSRKLRRLKERLRAQEKFPVAKYDSPEDLGAQIEQFLNERLDKYFPQGKKLSWLDKQNVEQGAFERSRKRLYVANARDYERLDKFVASKEKTLAVVGASGLGKSALLANWKEVCSKKFPDVTIVSHYVSASEKSDLPANILRRLTESIDPKVGAEESAPKTLDDASSEFKASVERYLEENPDRRLLFVVDGLNQLSETDDSKELRWLPDLPEGAQYLLSTVLSDHTFETIKRKRWNRYEINALDKARLKTIIEEFLASRGKTLTATQEEKIVKFPLATNPLVLRTFLDELCVFGIYEELDAEIDRYAQAEDVNEFFSKVFERLESNRQFVETNPEKRKGIVEKLALLLALARFGLDEEELCNVAELPQTAVSTFLCALDAQLVNRSGRYSFAHEYIRQAVLSRYADKIVETRRLLIDRFLKSINESKPNMQKLADKLPNANIETPEELIELLNFLSTSNVEYERGLQEVPFQYLQLKSWEELRLFLLDFDVLKRLYNYTFNCDFCAYWNAATRSGRKEFKFASYLELDSSDESHWFNLAYIAQAYTEFSTGEKAYQKALEILRKVAEENSDENKSSIATTLNNLANLHKDTNHMFEAEEEYKEALEIRRELARENPNAYLQHVAMTLNNLALLHKDTNRMFEAEEEYEEALEIYRELARENPNTYLQYVATTLNNLAILHSSTNRMFEVEEEYKEALEIRRELARENPNEYLPDVATTLNNLANLHSDTNRMFEAEQEYKEALEIRRKLARENPRPYNYHVTMTLNNLANLHKDTNHMFKAEEEYKEALEIRRELARENPNAYLKAVAETLNNLANLHSDTNRMFKAEQEYKEALEIYRELAWATPNAYLPDVAMTLNNLAALHSSTNRLSESEQEYQEALEIRRALARENPNAYLPDLADTLFNMTLFYYQRKEFTDAKELISDAISIYTEFAKFSPVYAERMKKALTLEGYILKAISTEN